MERCHRAVTGAEAELLACAPDVTGPCSPFMSPAMALRFSLHDARRQKPTWRRIGNQMGEDQALTE